MDKYCLNLLCPPEAEERVLDLLLDSAEDRLFTSSLAFSHGANHAQLSSLEQVMGRSKSALVQVLATRNELDALLSQLTANCPGVGLRYWVTQVALEGEIK